MMPPPPAASGSTLQNGLMPPPPRPPVLGTTPSMLLPFSREVSPDPELTQDEFITSALGNLLNTESADAAASFIVHMSQFLHQTDNLYYAYSEVLQVMLSLTRESLIDDAQDGLLTEPLSEFFMTLTKTTCCIIDKSPEGSENGDNVYFLDFLLDSSAAFVSTLQQERKRDEEDEEMHTGTVTTTDPIIGIMATETLPRALNALFIIGNYEHGFEALLPLVADIHTIYHRLTELNVPLDTSPDWSDLFERIIFCTQAYKAVTISSSQVKFSIEDLSRLTCHLYVAGLFSGGATTLTNSSSQETSLCPFASFTRFFVTSCLAILADSHNIKPTQDLFLFFQRELSALLVENAIKSRHPNPTSLLIDTKAMFAYTDIPKHLLRWTLPPFVALRNGQTDALLEGLSSYMGKEAKDIFASYFNDILLYIFFDCPTEPIRQTYEVFKYASSICNENLFELFKSPSKGGKFSEDCFKYFATQPNRTMVAVNFICDIRPTTHLDPGFLENFLQLTGLPKPNAEVFKKRHDFRASSFIHRVDTRILGSRDTVTDKVELLQSYAALLKFYGRDFVEKFKMKIYLSIRMLFGRFKAMPELRKKAFFDAACEIAKEFVNGVKTVWLQAELPGFCSLIVPFVTLTHLGVAPKAKELLECIFEVHHFQKQVYHQLYYLPWQEEGSLPRLRETIRRETGVSTLLESYIVFQIPEKVCELITYLKSDLFARKCRQILAIAVHTANTCTAIQIASLKTLSEVLEANINFFYQIFGTRRSDLKLYEDLAGIPLKLLGDDDVSFDMETLWEPEMYRMLKEIADVGSFFQTLVLRLFRCLKFSTGERLMLVARCLGLLGAIDCKFLGFEQLSLSDSYETSVKRPLTASQRARSPTTKMFHISIDPAIASLDYCHRRPFLPQTRQFKQIILETLIRRIKCVKMPSDFLDTNLAIKELMAVFTLEHQCQIGDIPANVIDEEGNVNQALLANYATNHRSQFVGRSGVGEDAKKAGFMDDLEKGLKWAKVERIRKNRDLTEELYEYVNVLATQTGCVVRKRIDRITSDSMEKFFCSVTPMMTFQAFLRNLLGMLYNVFLMEYQKHENGSDATIMKKRRKINYDELFSQYQASQAAVAGSSVRSGVKTQEFNVILEKVKSLQTPIEVFQLCYHTIVEAVDPEQTDIEPDFTLAYQLVPSLLILALSLAADQKSKQEEFALYFRSLITARLTLDPLFFSFDIGHMVSELIFFIYDYLVEFDQNRKTLHLYIVPNLVVRNRVNRFDDEYSGVLAMLKTVKAMDVARLAYAAKAYHKALYYLEKSYCEKQEVGLKDIPLNEFLQENLPFLGRIYVGMKDEDNVRGVSRMREGPFPKVGDMMNVALVEGDSLAGLMAGAKMVLEDRKQKGTPTLEAFDTQVAYFSELDRLHMDLSLFGARIQGDSKTAAGPKWSSALPQVMIDSTWKLGNWDEMETIVSSSSNNSFIAGYDLESNNSLANSAKSSPVKGNLGLGSNQRNAPSLTVLDATPYFASNIGHVLLSLQRGEGLFQVHQKLDDIRHLALAPLNAALLTNQKTAYQRTYQQSIVPLHLIHDVMLFEKMIFARLVEKQSASQGSGCNANGDGAQQDMKDEEAILKAFSEMKKGWEARNRILPLSAYSDSIMKVLDVQRTLVKILQEHVHRRRQLNGGGESLEQSDPYAVELFRYWAQAMSAALEAGQLDRAYANMLEAFTLSHQEIEKKNREFLLGHGELAKFVMNSAKVHWCRRDERGALRLLKTQLDRNYSQIKRICCLDAVRAYTTDKETDSDLIEIARQLSFSIPPVRQVNISGASSSNRGISGRSNASGSGYMSSLTQVVKVVSQEKRKLFESESPENLMNYALIQLQYAQYAEESHELGDKSLMTAFRAVTAACPKWEEGHYALAMYCTTLAKETEQSLVFRIETQTNCNLVTSDSVLELKQRTILEFAESLKCGFAFHAVSVPLMINTWIELGYECDAFTNAHRHSTAPYAHVINRTARDIEATVDKIAKRIQACTAAILDLSQTGNNAIFLCVIETLIAHFEHPMRVIAEGVQKILTRLYADFPHHLIWQMSRSLNHRDDRGPSRRAIVSNDILHNAIKLWRNLHSGIETSPANTLGGDIDLAKYHESFKVFTRAIGEVANYKELKVQGRKRNTDDLSLKNHFPALPSAVESMRASCKFMMPTNRLFQPSLLNLERTSHREHFNHFFRHLYVENVDDTVVQMSSLQAPKRLSFLCADGTRRMILCKSSDDLRKDRLAINMANMFNQCYSGEMPKMESLRRTLKDLRADDVMEEKMRTKRRLNPLKVQTYFICPLTDHFGIIEWIPGLVPMKQLIEGEYTRTRQSKLAYHQAKDAFVRSLIPAPAPRQKRIAAFKKALPTFSPPVFHLWFQKYYADAYSWSLAKRNFTRTAAVYSIIGYVLGLGDRHSENLLINPADGSVVHVDFNCLFMGGENFQVPECVPFRLTHNMTAAMGLTGFEGTFRYTAEDVMLLLRQYRRLFSKLVTHLLFEPLKEWTVTNKTEPAAYHVREKAVFGVEGRLAGVISRTPKLYSVPRGGIVSVAGQIDYLIKEATDQNNLGSMYHGWSAYM